MNQSTAIARFDEIEPKVLREGVSEFLRPPGNDLLVRTAPYLDWQERRCQAGLCPYPNSAAHSPGCTVRFHNGGVQGGGLDFASRDPLALTAHRDVQHAAVRAVEQAGPTALATASRELEAEIAEWLGERHVVLFESGLDARFFVIGSLVHRYDYVVIDACADPSFEKAATEATPNTVLHGHLDLEELHAQLCEIRSRDTTHGILVITESLFRLDSDAPDLAALQCLCREHGAKLLVDLSHDAGLMGPGGTGNLGTQHMLGKVDLVMGSFATSLASNVGFLATDSKQAAEYVKFRSGAHVLPRTPSSIHCAVAQGALRVARSEAGEAARQEIRERSGALRAQLADRGIRCLGETSPFVLVHLGWEGGARLVSALIHERGLHADLMEHPLVPPGSARLCLQVAAGGSAERIPEAAEILADSIHSTWQLVARM
jgi:7-keto-8-aminopelargonate synthetase-like enzyme